MRFEPVHGDAHVRATIELVQNLSSASTAQGAFEAFMSRFFSLRPVDHFVGVVPVSVEEGSYRILYHVSRELVQGGAAFPRRNFEARDLEALPVQREGLVSRLIQTPAPQLVCDADLSDDAGLKAIAPEAKTVMALPLYAGERVVEWVLGLSKLSQGIGAPDVQQAVMTSNFMEMTNAHLLSLEEISRLNRLLTNQFEEVAKIQQALLPARLPSIPTLSLATSYLTCDHAGGDYYDFFPLSGGRWAVLIADVSGHGAGAATVMAMLHAILHCYQEDVCCPARMLSFANDKLLNANIEGSFVTAFLGIYDPAKAELTFASAGHPAPRLKRGGDGRVLALDGAGTYPLGIFGPFELERASVRLEPKDTVILYTDGIVEEFGAEREMFGVGRLDEALHRCSGDPDCVMDSVHQALFQHTGRRTRADDQTLVAFRYAGMRAPNGSAP